MDDSFHIPLAGISFSVEIARAVPALILIIVRVFDPCALFGHELNEAFNIHSHTVNKAFAITMAESCHGGLGQVFMLSYCVRIVFDWLKEDVFYDSVISSVTYPHRSIPSVLVGGAKVLVAHKCFAPPVVVVVRRQLQFVLVVLPLAPHLKCLIL